MKKLILITSVVLATIVACKKKETTAPATIAPSTTPITTVVVNGFVWSENGGANTNADSAYFTNQYKTLIAYKAGQTKFEINLNGTSAATYSIDTTGANALTFVTTTANNSAKSGMIKITNNAANKISGNFDVIMNSGGLTSLKGTFTDIAIK